MKKIISIVLSIVLLTSMFSMSNVLAVEQEKVNIQFHSMDSLLGVDNEGTPIKKLTAPYTEGNAAASFQWEYERVGLFWYIRCPNYQTSQGLDISGATHMIFDFYINDVSKWDIYFGSGTLNLNSVASNWDNNQCGVIGNAALRSQFDNIKSGWNHIVLPIDLSTATTTLLHRIRFYFNSAAFDLDAVFMFDDIRFVNEAYLNSKEYKDITAAKEAISAFSTITAQSSQQERDNAYAIYDALTTDQKALVYNYVEPNTVNIQFLSLDSTYGLSNEGSVDRSVVAPYTQGSGSVKFLWTADRTGGLFWYMRNSQYETSAGVDIAGAEYITFDFYVDDISAWNPFPGGSGGAKINLNSNASGWDNNKCGSVSTADLKSVFTNLHTGWNHIALPIDFTGATTTILHNFRFYFSGASCPAGFYTLIDDVRFVSGSYLNSRAYADSIAAKEAIAAFSTLTDQSSQSDKDIAYDAYDALTETQKALVYNYIPANNVNVQFRSMDNTRGVVGDENVALSVGSPYTEGKRAVKFAWNQPKNALNWNVKCDNYGSSAGVDISGAEYMSFDLFINDVTKFALGSGESGISLNSNADATNNGNCGAVSSANVNNAFSNLANGWNHLVLPLDLSGASSTVLHSFNLNISDVTCLDGLCILVDDVRFINRICWRSRNFNDYIAAKNAISAYSLITYSSSQEQKDAADSIYNGLTDNQKSFVFNYGGIGVEPVNVQFRSMDSTYGLSNEGNVDRSVSTIFTEGTGAVKFLSIDARTGGLFWYVRNEEYTTSAGIDIVGAEFMTFDFYVSDASAWQPFPGGIGGARINLNSNASGWDNNEFGEITLNSMTSVFSNLHSGWNHIVLPIQYESAVTTVLNNFRFYLSGATCSAGFYTIMDDVRFVNGAYLNSKDYKDTVEAKDAIAAFSALNGSSSQSEINNAYKIYRNLTFDQKALVYNYIKVSNPDINVQFKSMDNTNGLGNDGDVTRTVVAPYTQGTGAVEYQWSQASSNGLYWYFNCDYSDLSAGVNIGGAEYLTFDLFVSDISALNLFPNDNSNAGVNLNTNASGNNSNCGDVPAEIVRKMLSDLKTGWNHVVLPIRFDNANSSILHNFRLYFEDATCDAGFYAIIDDVRFINQAFIDNGGYNDSTAAKDVIALISTLKKSSSQNDIFAATNAYDSLTNAQKALVTNADILNSLPHYWSFSSNKLYQTKETISSVPLTMEATIGLPKDFDDNTPGGVIIGNNPGILQTFSLEIYTNGQVRLYVSGDVAQQHFLFTNTDVRTGELVHVAVTLDPQNRVASCYINGELVQTITSRVTYAGSLYTPMFIGGDLRSGNPSYFKGNIKNVAAYSDIRTQSEIASDMVKVEIEDSDLMFNYDFSKFALNSSVVKDMSHNLNDLVPSTSNFGLVSQQTPLEDYAYSIAVIGDPQFVSNRYPEKLHYIYDYILDNAESQKIALAVGLGDFTDIDADREWINFKEQIHRLDGKVPYAIVRGNHDTIQQYNKYCPLSDFDGIGGSFDGTMLNTWQTLEVGNVKYLLLNLDYGPSDAVLAWAETIIQAHPDYNVIINTHSYLYKDGTTCDAEDDGPTEKGDYGNGTRGYNNGCDMWNKLINKYSNIVMVLSGHNTSSQLIVNQREGQYGNVVTSMMINPQAIDTNYSGLGMVAMLYFSEDGKTVQARWYSTVRNQWFSTTNMFNMNVANADDETYVEKTIRLVDELDVTNGKEIVDTKAAYDALSDNQKALITDSAKVQQLNQAVAEYNTAKIVMNQIDALNGEDQGAIENARTSYNALPQVQKGYVDQYNINRLIAFEQGDDPDLNIRTVTELIDSLGLITAKSREKIVNVRSAFDSLAENEKNLVANYSVLTKAEKIMKMIDEGRATIIGDVNDSYTVNTFDALRTLQYSLSIVDLDDETASNIDVNNDGETDSIDALLILQYTVGLINDFPKNIAK